MTSALTRCRARRQLLSALLLLLYLPACSAWHTGTPSPAQFIENEKPSMVRVTRTDGSTFKLRSPAVRGDSLIGQRGSGVASYDTVYAVSLPLSDVRSVAVKQFSAGRTIALLGAITLGLYIAACSGPEGIGNPCSN